MDELSRLPPKPGTSRVAIRLDKRLKRQIDVMARKENLTRTTLITLALKKYVASGAGTEPASSSIFD